MTVLGSRLGSAQTHIESLAAYAARLLETHSVHLMPAYSKAHWLGKRHPVSFRLGEGAVPKTQRKIRRKTVQTPIKAPWLSRVAYSPLGRVEAREIERTFCGLLCIDPSYAMGCLHGFLNWTKIVPD